MSYAKREWVGLRRPVDGVEATEDVAVDEGAMSSVLMVNAGFARVAVVVGWVLRKAGCVSAGRVRA